MLRLLQKRWFLIALVTLIATGLVIDTSSGTGIAACFVALVNPRWTTAIVLFLMSFSLDSRQLSASFRTPLPVLLASVVNLGIIPLMAWSLMRWQQLDDFAVGLMIAGSVPCTLAAASVWTRRAKGNDAVSLLVTLTTNSICFLVTPFWLTLATRHGVALDATYMIVRLLQAVLVPTIAGQSLRLWRPARQFATRYKTPIGVVAQVFILSLVFVAAANAGRRLHSDAVPPTVIAVAVVWLTCVAIHLIAMSLASVGARAAGFTTADRKAVAFAASQKTLPIGVLLATDPGMFGSGALPFVIFPMIMYHASQLFIDTLLADRWASTADGD